MQVPTVAADTFAKIASAAKPIIFQLKKHAPEILVGAGSASVLGGTVLACKATLKAAKIADEPVEVPDDLDGEDRDRLAKKLAIYRGGDIVKQYLPAAGLVGGGIGMLVAAKSIEHRRFTAMLGAYSALQSTFDEYRSRVAGDLGKDAELKYWNGAEEVTVKVEQEPEDGKKKGKIAKEQVTVFTRGEDPYHRIFDECNSPSEWRENMETNKFFLECQQTVLNQELRAQGRIFLNDVYKRLGFEYCEVGQFVGWLADDIEGCGDGYIDFGIDYAAIEDEIVEAQRENRRPEPSIWLNFNCDGEVWDKPLTKKYDI